MSRTSMLLPEVWTSWFSDTYDIIILWLQMAANNRFRVVFLYKKMDGVATRSYGINVAQLAGLDAFGSLLERAKEKALEMEQKCSTKAGHWANQPTSCTDMLFHSSMCRQLISTTLYSYTYPSNLPLALSIPFRWECLCIFWWWGFWVWIEFEAAIQLPWSSLNAWAAFSFSLFEQWLPAKSCVRARNEKLEVVHLNLQLPVVFDVLVGFLNIGLPLCFEAYVDVHFHALARK